MLYFVTCWCLRVVSLVSSAQAVLHLVSLVQQFIQYIIHRLSYPEPEDDQCFGIQGSGYHGTKLCCELLVGVAFGIAGFRWNS